MKYAANKKLTKGQLRTLDTFSKQMFILLSNKSFEEITVNELCDSTSYPRATFYNYFDDKYDLLNYCWEVLSFKIRLNEYKHGQENEMLFVYFDRIYDFSKDNIEIINKIMRHNSEIGYMFSSFRNYLNNYMRLIFKDCPEANSKNIPNTLLADYYSNTLFLVWKWIIVNDDTCSKKQAHAYLKMLIH